jgi:quercetin dioxygenase-like cupin family protein
MKFGRCLVVAAVLVVLETHHDHSTLEAQPHDPITVTRMYTGADGQTHTGNVAIDMLPRIERNEHSETVKVTGLTFSRWSPGFENSWHPASHRQYVIVLSGHGEIEVSNGQKIPLNPGRMLLAEDVTGKGHITRTVGAEDCLALLVQLDDQ